METIKRVNSLVDKAVWVDLLSDTGAAAGCNQVSAFPGSVRMANASSPVDDALVVGAEQAGLGGSGAPAHLAALAAVVGLAGVAGVIAACHRMISLDAAPHQVGSRNWGPTWRSWAGHSCGSNALAVVSVVIERSRAELRKCRKSGLDPPCKSRSETGELVTRLHLITALLHEKALETAGSDRG